MLLCEHVKGLKRNKIWRQIWTVLFFPFNSNFTLAVCQNICMHLIALSTFSMKCQRFCFNLIRKLLEFECLIRVLYSLVMSYIIERLPFNSLMDLSNSLFLSSLSLRFKDWLRQSREYQETGHVYGGKELSIFFMNICTTCKIVVLFK